MGKGPTRYNGGKFIDKAIEKLETGHGSIGRKEKELKVKDDNRGSSADKWRSLPTREDAAKIHELLDKMVFKEDEIDVAQGYLNILKREYRKHIWLDALITMSKSDKTNVFGRIHANAVENIGTCTLVRNLREMAHVARLTRNNKNIKVKTA